ncbi:MAG: DinB family protein [Candidatus Odinarchaeota archaeon]
MTDTENEQRTNNILLKQFNCSWNMLREAIDKVPQDLWAKVAVEWSFSWVVYHIIESADFYCRNTPEGMEWGKRAGIERGKDSESVVSEKKSGITKEILIIYLDEIKEKLSRVLGATTDSELLTRDGFTWFDSVLEKFLYLLRHNMHHVGELNKTLRDNECERIRWT